MLRSGIFTIAAIVLSVTFRMSAVQTVDEALIERLDSYVNSDPDSAVILCDNVLQQTDASDAAVRSRLYAIRGNALFTIGDNDAAIADFSEAVRLSAAASDTISCVNALSDLGVAYRVSQQPDSAFSCYNRALELLAGHDEPMLEANLLTSMAVLFANGGRLNDALPFAEKAFDRAIVSDDIETEIYAGSTLGSALFLVGEHERGLGIQRRVVAISERNGVPRYMLKTYASIIAMHRRLGNADSVSCYVARGEKLLPSIPEGSVESIGFLEQSFVTLTSMGRYRESLDLQFRILELTDSRPFFPLEKLWHRIALNYKGLGDVERMSDAYERAMELSDSVSQSDLNKQISDFSVKYRTAEKELEIARLEAGRARLNMIIIVILVMLLAGAVAVVMWRRSVRRKTELDNISARLSGIEQERGRLARELHDGVCNDLLGIELMASGSSFDRDEVLSMISDVRNSVRTISHELLPPRFTDLTLPQLLTAYALKSDGFVSFVADGDCEDLDPMCSVNLYRIVQEWVGNVRRHGDAGHVTVELHEDNGQTALVVEDDGSAAVVPEKSAEGLGMENINRRVKAMRGTVSVTRADGKNRLTVEF